MSDLWQQPDTWLKCGLALLTMLVAVFREDIRKRIRVPAFTKKRKLNKIRTRLKLLHELHNNPYGIMMKLVGVVIGPFAVLWPLMVIAVVWYGALLALGANRPKVLFYGFGPSAFLVLLGLPEMIGILAQLSKVNTNIKCLAKKGNRLAEQLGLPPLEDELTQTVSDPYDSGERLTIALDEVNARKDSPADSRSDRAI